MLRNSNYELFRTRIHSGSKGMGICNNWTGMYSTQGISVRNLPLTWISRWIVTFLLGNLIQIVLGNRQNKELFMYSWWVSASCYDHSLPTVPLPTVPTVPPLQTITNWPLINRTIPITTIIRTSMARCLWVCFIVTLVCGLASGRGAFFFVKTFEFPARKSIN